MNDLKTTNRLLLIIVITMLFYLLKVLSFIVIPLVLSMFIAVLFLPLMRWQVKKRVPRFLSIFNVVIIILVLLKGGGELIRLTSKEILSADTAFLEKAQAKIILLVESVEHFFGIERNVGENILLHYTNDNDMMGSFTKSLDFVGDTLTMTLMTAFFVVLLLAGSFNFQHFLSASLFKQKHASVKTFMRIEKDVIKFVKVKFFISLLTGLGFSLACLAFGVNFPLFWGLFAFSINFVQMVGSVISVVLLSIFAFVELDPSTTLLFFSLTITGIQVLFGGVLEPVFMGKTFSLNIIVVLIMLMLWGYIWGVPGMILSIPITVVLKIILDQFENTRKISGLMESKRMY